MMKITTDWSNAYLDGEKYKIVNKYSGELKFSDLIGKTLESIEGMTDESENVLFITNTGEKYLMYHDQDCCEYVRLNDVCGKVVDLIGTPITQAEENTNDGETEYGTETWTFYRIGTNKGSVQLRWLGESNGYYSESVDFVLLKKDGE